MENTKPGLTLTKIVRSYEYLVSPDRVKAFQKAVRSGVLESVIKEYLATNIQFQENTVTFDHKQKDQWYAFQIVRCIEEEIDKLSV